MKVENIFYHSNKYALHNQFCFASITFNKKPFLLLVHKERQEKAYSHPSIFHLQHHWMLYRQKRFQQYTFYSLCKIHTCSTSPLHNFLPYHSWIDSMLLSRLENIETLQIHAKGQLISKCPFGVIVWTKIPMKNLTNFCPRI